MKKQSPSQLGICSWSLKPKDPSDLAQSIKALGLSKVQLALNVLTRQGTSWPDCPKLLRDQGITIVSGMMGSHGEDYSSLESIKRTGGVILDEHWDANWAGFQKNAELARNIGLNMVSMHAGFIPHDPSDPVFIKMSDRLGRIAKLFADHKLDLIFETGQEDAPTLNAFLDIMAKRGYRNIGINFDPANMILYDKGDPIASLKKLMPRVKQIHIKDAVRTAVPGTWGKEVPIGDGQVDWKAFMQVLAQSDYAGNLVIEREAGDNRINDIRTAISRISARM